MNKHCYWHPALHLQRPKRALSQLLSLVLKAAAHAPRLPEDARVSAQAQH